MGTDHRMGVVGYKESRIGRLPSMVQQEVGSSDDYCRIARTKFYFRSPRAVLDSELTGHWR